MLRNSMVIDRLHANLARSGPLTGPTDRGQRVDRLMISRTLAAARRGWGVSSLPAPACTCPNAPNSTFVNDRFIALHMMIDSTNPDAPSSAPAMISSLLFSTNPIKLADKPAYEFNNAITVGMTHCRQQFQSKTRLRARKCPQIHIAFATYSTKYPDYGHPSKINCATCWTMSR